MGFFNRMKDENLQVCFCPPIWYDKKCKECWNFRDCISYLKENYSGKNKKEKK